MKREQVAEELGVSYTITNKGLQALNYNRARYRIAYRRWEKAVLWLRRLCFLSLTLSLVGLVAMGMTVKANGSPAPLPTGGFLTAIISAGFTLVFLIALTICQEIADRRWDLLRRLSKVPGLSK